MEIKHLKEKWVIKWTEIWNTENKKEYQIECASWFNLEKDALNFVEELKAEKPIGGYPVGGYKIQKKKRNDNE